MRREPVLVQELTQREGPICRQPVCGLGFAEQVHLPPHRLARGGVDRVKAWAEVRFEGTRELLLELLPELDQLGLPVPAGVGGWRVTEQEQMLHDQPGQLLDPSPVGAAMPSISSIR